MIISLLVIWCTIETFCGGSGEVLSTLRKLPHHDFLGLSSEKASAWSLKNVSTYQAGNVKDVRDLKYGKSMI